MGAIPAELGYLERPHGAVAGRQPILELRNAAEEGGLTGYSLLVRQPLRPHGDESRRQPTDGSIPSELGNLTSLTELWLGK